MATVPFLETAGLLVRREAGRAGPARMWMCGAGAGAGGNCGAATSHPSLPPGSVPPPQPQGHCHTDGLPLRGPAAPPLPL